MMSRAFMLLPLASVTLGVGMAIYHWVERLAWPDAFLNASMLLGGMGPDERARSAPRSCPKELERLPARRRPVLELDKLPFPQRQSGT